MDKCPQNACLQLTSRQFRITLHSNRDRSAVCGERKMYVCEISEVLVVAALSSDHNGHNGRAIIICQYDGFPHKSSFCRNIGQQSYKKVMAQTSFERE